MYVRKPHRSQYREIKEEDTYLREGQEIKELSEENSSVKKRAGPQNDVDYFFDNFEKLFKISFYEGAKQKNKSNNLSPEKIKKSLHDEYSPVKTNKKNQFSEYNEPKAGSFIKQKSCGLPPITPAAELTSNETKPFSIQNKNFSLSLKRKSILNKVEHPSEPDLQTLPPSTKHSKKGLLRPPKAQDLPENKENTPFKEKSEVQQSSFKIKLMKMLPAEGIPKRKPAIFLENRNQNNVLSQMDSRVYGGDNRMPLAQVNSLNQLNQFQIHQENSYYNQQNYQKQYFNLPSAKYKNEKFDISKIRSRYQHLFNERTEKLNAFKKML